MINDQAHFIHDFVEKHGPKFNKELFLRSDSDIIESLKKIILSCQIDSYFQIKVKNFRVVEGYYEVNETLRKYQDYLQAKKSSKSKGDEDNRYNFIDLKESALKLLIVTYYISVKDEHDTIDAIIAIPRVIDKFYFLINGSYYSAMYQIVDASTYNNATSKSNSHCVVLKTPRQPIRIFRNVCATPDRALIDTRGVIHHTTQYDCMTFSKTVSTALYIFAMYGYYGALEFFGLQNAIILTDKDMMNDNFYTFNPRNLRNQKYNTNIFINVPKMLFDGNYVLQHVVNTLSMHIETSATVNDIFMDDYWLERLGASYSSSTTADLVEKGKNILISIQGVYDIETKEDIHLPEEYKSDIFKILAWMLKEYSNLKLKDNLNILTKKIRCSSYIASMYAKKISDGIYRLSRYGKRVDLSAVRKVVATNPLYLIGEISKCPLVNFRNIVTDMDSLVALKCTYKGESGIGESGSNSIPAVFRQLHVSNMGILDPDASSPTDPGISGSLVPTLQTYQNGFFSEFTEPLTWDAEYAKLFNAYKDARGFTEILEFRKKVLSDTSISDYDIAHGRTAENTLLNVASNLTDEQNDEFNGLPLEGSGIIYYE